VRPEGKTKLGFFPLPTAEATRLRSCLVFPPEFSDLDPCVGEGVAFTELLKGAGARRYGIEIDVNRAERATNLGVETLHADAMDVRCPAEALSLLYLNPPYDREIGQSNNQRLEAVFLEHTYRWLKPGGVLVFVIPQPQLKSCARILSEHFSDFTVYKLTDPALSSTSKSRCLVPGESAINSCVTPRRLSQCADWRCLRRVVIWTH